MLEERGGWFVRNVRDLPWKKSATFGKACTFDPDPESPLPQTGVRIFMLDPGRSNCRYHRENAQEDFLVLHGQAKLLVNGEERPLRQWDFVHCPAGVTHVFVGAGDAPCTILAIGHRPPAGQKELFYPKSEMARQYDAEAPEATPDPRVAYSDARLPEDCDTPDWPL